MLKKYHIYRRTGQAETSSKKKSNFQKGLKMIQTAAKLIQIKRTLQSSSSTS